MRHSFYGSSAWMLMDRCSIFAVSQYLDGSLPFAALRQLGEANHGLAPGRIYCSVSPPLPDTPKRVSSTGWSSGGQPQPSWARLFMAPRIGETQPSVLLTRTNQQWSFRPTLGTTINAQHTVVEVHSPWAEVLCHLAIKTLAPLLHFKSTVDWINAGIEHEIEARLLSYTYRGPYHFFMDFGEATAWCVATMWDRWETNNLSDTERIRQLGRYAQTEISKIEFLKMHPAAVAPLLRRGERIFPELQGEAIEQPFPDPSGHSAVDKMNEHMLGLEMLSKGRDLPIAKTNLNLLKRRHDKTEDLLRSSGMWWWREVYDRAGSAESEEFTDNWERSAFFYEFRARMKPTDGLPSWDGFERPWNALDRTQRGILYYLWPPSQAGDHLRVLERPRSRASYVKYMLKVDFARPLDVVLEDVKVKWSALEPELVHFLGVANTSISRKKRSPVLEKAPTVPGKWSLLEALDLQNYLGSSGHKLSKTDKITYKRQLDEYHTACQRAGISP